MELLDLHDSYYFVFEACADAVFVYELDEHDVPGHFIEVNGSACTLLGYSREELLSMSVYNLVPSDVSIDDIQHFLHAMITNHNLHTEWTHVSKSGEPIPVELNVRLLSYSNKRVVVTVCRDMCGRKTMEQVQKRMDDILSRIDLFVWSFDLNARQLTFCSGALEELYGIAQDELLQDIDKVIELIYPDDLRIFAAAWEQILTGESFEIEYRVRDRHGEIRWLQSHGTPWRDPNGVIRRVDAVSIDITDRKLSEIKSEERQQRFESLLNLIPDSVVVHRDGVVRYANDATLRMLGLRESPVGHQLWEFFPQDSRQSLSERYSHSEDYIHNMIPSVKHRLVRAEGTEFPVETASVLITDDGKLSMLTVTKDISQQVETETELRWLANHDSLTGLPNRRFFSEHLDELIETSKVGGSQDQHAILFIDMDRFKLVNDSFGHAFGDRALQEMTLRLQECLPDNAVLSRFGGDEFAILYLNVASEEQVALYADRIQKRFNRAIIVGEREFYITPSIGVAMYPSAGKDSETLLKRADSAMYAAKAKGGNLTDFYRQAEENILQERLDLETDLKKALERNEFFVCYQPKFRVDTGQIHGYEALVRWNHSKRGIISPAEFIPVAEECGVIAQLGEWVLREACRQSREWHKKGYSPLVVSVNVSPKQFQMSNMVEVIKHVLDETQLDPALLTIEITEGLLVHNSSEIASALKMIRMMGVLVAIDDFGTGYSSLAYLQKFEPTHLKIDQSFVSVMFSDEGSKSIVNAVIDLAHNLGMQVVAEGVETAEQLLYLKEHGCDMAQGYLYSRPVNHVDFERDFLRHILSTAGVDKM